MNISEKAKCHFRQMLEEGYSVESSGRTMCRLEYLSDYFFDFVTYDFVFNYKSETARDEEYEAIITHINSVLPYVA